MRRTVARALVLVALIMVDQRVVSAQAVASGSSDQEAADEQLSSTIRFSFEIRDLITNHEFEGQRNSFSVTYEYVASLQGAPFDPDGHPVSADVFPYFQTVRDDIIDYIHSYPDRSDFHEVFANNIARFVMQKYPQLRWIELTVQVPAFASVTTDRMVVVQVTRDDTP